MSPKFILRSLTLITLMAWGAVLYLGTRPVPAQQDIILPTRIIIPTETPSNTPTATRTPSPTSTPTVTATSTSTLTLIPTLTPTLSVRVIDIEAVMPGVYIPSSATPFPFGTILLPAPPHPIEPLPDAETALYPFTDWHQFESTYPQISYYGAWTRRYHTSPRDQYYHRTEQVGDVLRFTFKGEGLRVRYVQASNMGTFEIVVDGVVIDTIHAKSDQFYLASTRVYTLESGQHTLEIRNTGSPVGGEHCQTVGIDAIQIYRAPAGTLIIPPAPPATETPAPRPVAGVELIASPPTIQPTPSPIPPQERDISLVIAYDENGNRAIDPSEGISGISVRVIEAGTNREIAQAYTDGQGYAHLRVVTGNAVRVVVPYFGQVWDIPARSTGESRFTLLLTPGTQPGLIP
jgi:hypothetical protein